MRTIRIIGFALFAILMSLSACSGGGDEPIEPTPKPEITKSEITIDSSIITNGLSFTYKGGEQSISFTTNENWTLSVARTTSGTTWCTASATSGSKGTANVKFTVTENTEYDNRSVSVTIKSGIATKTFTISQKGVDALLITTDKYEISQEGGTIEIEVKANISYKLEISETAKDWIKESSSRTLNVYKHKLDITANEDVEKREGEIIFKSGDKVETVKIYQAGGAILLLSQNEYTVSGKGDTISVDISSNIDFGVQMPDVDWIVDKASSRGMSSHTLKYVVKANEEYNSRSASIVYYDKNSNLKDTLKIIQSKGDIYTCSLINETPGLLKNILADKNPDQINKIIIKGKLNDKDISYLADLAQGCLTHIDLSESTIDNKENVSFTGFSGTKIFFISLPEGIISIGDYSFTNSKNLNEVIMPNSVKSIGQRAFWQCFALSKIKMSNNIKIIDEEAFSYCEKLLSIDLPNSLLRIEKEAFKGCKSLVTLFIPHSIEYIGNEAFFYCISLEQINISEGVKTIKYGAFRQCEALEKLNLPSTIINIESEAFASCNNLKKINIPEQIETIKSGTFYACEKLDTIIISKSISSIEKEAFAFCRGLKYISIGAQVKEIGTDAFYNCLNIIDLYCYPLNPPILKNAIFSSEIKSKTTLYVPNNSIEKYKKETYWKEFNNIKGF